MIGFLKTRIIIFKVYRRIYNHYFLNLFRFNFIRNIIILNLASLLVKKKYVINVDYYLYKKSKAKTKISLLCPTRGRIKNIEHLIQSIKDTSDNINDVEMVFYIDNDDVNIKSFFNSLIIKEKELNLTILIGKRIILSQLWNICSEHINSEICMHCADDIVFKTNRWDKIVVNTFEESFDKILFVYGDDGNSADDFGTHGFLHINWIHTLGYFVPPYFSSDFADTWINDIAKQLNRHKRINIQTLHNHPDIGKSPYDLTYLENMKRGLNDQVRRLYDLLDNYREIDIIKLKFKIIEENTKELTKLK